MKTWSESPDGHGTFQPFALVFETEQDALLLTAVLAQDEVSQFCRDHGLNIDDLVNHLRAHITNQTKLGTLSHELSSRL